MEVNIRKKIRVTTDKVTLIVTPKEKAAFKKLAESNNLTMSDLFKQIVNSMTNSPQKEAS